MNIYTVTVFRLEQAVQSSRTWAWYKDFATAEASVLDNELDMFEDGSYDHAIIEEIEEGPGARSVSRRWYKVSADSEMTVTRLDSPPRELSGTVNWGIG